MAPVYDEHATRPTTVDEMFTAYGFHSSCPLNLTKFTGRQTQSEHYTTLTTPTDSEHLPPLESKKAELQYKRAVLYHIVEQSIHVSDEYTNALMARIEDLEEEIKVEVLQQQLAAWEAEQKRLIFRHRDQELSSEELSGAPFVAEEKLVQLEDVVNQQWDEEERERQFDFNAEMEDFLAAEAVWESAEFAWGEEGMVIV